MKLLFFILAGLLTGSHASSALAPGRARSLPKASSYPRQSVSRTIQISLVMDIHDENIFEDDRDYTRNETLRPIVLSETNGLTKTTSYNTRAGGDIVVEVLLTLTLRPSDLSVQVLYAVELYVGKDPSIAKPVGRISGSRVATKDQDTEIKVTVHDMQYEAGDKADVTLMISNTPSL
jgi:hypothetical protein